MTRMRCALAAVLVVHGARAVSHAVGADPEQELQAHIRAFVADLADDDVRWNAHDAIDVLTKIGLDAVPALEEALGSADWQQRQLAASVLRRVDEYRPSPSMLRVTVEGLRDDHLPIERRNGEQTACTYVYNAADGMRYLLGHAARAEGLLVTALDSDDLQQRFLAAYVLGVAGRVRSVADAAPLLIEHLRDNDVRGDALMSGSALYGFGDAVLPYLADAMPTADRQQADMLRLVFLDITSPPRNKQELEHRGTLHTITDRYFDPVVQRRVRALDLHAPHPGRPLDE